MYWGIDYIINTLGEMVYHLVIFSWFHNQIKSTLLRQFHLNIKKIAETILNWAQGKPYYANQQKRKAITDMILFP